MAFTYSTPTTQAQQTPTFGSKPLLCKSFKIDIAGGSGFTTATTYTLGSLPKGSQVVNSVLLTTTAVAGGTVSACTLAVAVGALNIYNALNVFALNISAINATTYYNLLSSLPNGDQIVTYTPTLTGAGPTAGVMFINIWYVV